MLTTCKRVALLAALFLCLPASAFAAEPVSYKFETTQKTQFGESVYVLGDIPELGNGDVTRAVRMVPTSYPRWAVTVSIPAGTRFKYRFLLRNNSAGQIANKQNNSLVGGVLSGYAVGAPLQRSVTVQYYSGFGQAKLHYEKSPGRFEDVSMQRVGSGRSFQESLWSASITSSVKSLRFVFHNGAGSYDRSPNKAHYQSPMANIVVQDGQVYGYKPQANGGLKGQVIRVGGWYSKTLKNSRDIFVYLPRQYNSSNRRYPVIYMHDGQNLFGADAMFGGWRAAVTADRLISEGRMEEVILVGVANTSARMSEYIPPEDGGAGQNYAQFLKDELKPWIDSRLRTHKDAANTGVMGSSLGGIISLYIGWRHPGVFGKVGSLSGSYWLTKFTGAARGEANRNLKIWLDSGSGGASADGMAGTFGVRDMLLSKGYVLGKNVQHYVDFGAQHNEVYWKNRLYMSFEYLFPAK